MKRALLCILVLSFLPLAAQAQSKPKHFFQEKKWWIGEAVILASVAVDYAYSSRAISSGFQEGNILLGPYPSTGRMVGIGFAVAGFWTAVHAGSYEIMKNDPSPAWRNLSLMSTPIEAGIIHGYGAARAAHVCSVSTVCN